MADELKKDLIFTGAVALVSAVASQTCAGGVLTWAISCLPHELGHTLAFWLTSVPAIPTPFSTFGLAETRQLWCFALQLTACAYVYHQARESGSRLWSITPIVWAALLLLCSFGLRPAAREQLVAWAGIGGELIVSTLMIALGLALGPDVPWHVPVKDQHRIFLFWGAAVFASTAARWLLIIRNPTLVPFGGVGSEAGDLDALHDQFGWSVPAMTRSYLFTALVCVVFLAFVALLARDSRETPAPPPGRTWQPGSSR